MRPIFVPFDPDNGIETESDVYENYPRSVEIVEVEGGWLVFYSFNSFQVWSNQQ